ncbi:hypothetical protein CDEST_04920 [Colletotrichum destructivum]|uniref:Uncharacterized protein n=1 Tax=Colletotrichum destructivum TaxID=34406 RepID=A0AAX4I9P2_9PEZI|nr:hypothetical protein CDEST_04920 [Colletotrichum destructivum]
MWAVASREWRRDDQGNWHGVTRYLAACRPNRCLVNHQPCPTCGGFTRVDHTTVAGIAAAGSGALEGLGWRARVDRYMRARLAKNARRHSGECDGQAKRRCLLISRWVSLGGLVPIICVLGAGASPEFVESSGFFYWAVPCHLIELREFANFDGTL